MFVRVRGYVDGGENAKMQAVMEEKGEGYDRG